MSMTPEETAVMKTLKVSLLPCPFCGREAEIFLPKLGIPPGVMLGCYPCNVSLIAQTAAPPWMAMLAGAVRPQRALPAQAVPP